MTDVPSDVVRVHGELLAHDRDDRLLVLLDGHRVLDRERRARTAGAEADDRGIDLARELFDLLAITRRGLTDLRAGLDRDRLRAVALQVLRPDVRDQLPRSPRPVGAQTDGEARERPLETEGGGADLAGRLRRGPADPDRVGARVHTSTVAIYAPAYNAVVSSSGAAPPGCATRACERAAVVDGRRPVPDLSALVRRLERATGSATCRASSSISTICEWLGVDAIWLSPITVSPNADWGYDVADYCAVQPEMGTLADVRRPRRGRARDAASASCSTSSRTTRVISTRGSSTPDRREPRAHRDWYVWADPKPDGSPPNNWVSGFGGPAWTLDATDRAVLHAQPPRRAARPQLVERRSARRVRRRSSGSGSTAASTDSASTSATSSSRTPSCATTRPRPTTIRSTRSCSGNGRSTTGTDPRCTTCSSRWRTIADSYDPPRLLFGETPVDDAATLARVLRRRPRRAAPRVQLPVHQRAVRGRGDARRRRSASKRCSRRAHGRRGPARTTTCRASRRGGRATIRARPAPRC